jgi:hypothetical protein
VDLTIALVGLVLSAVSTGFTAMAYVLAIRLAREERLRRSEAAAAQALAEKQALAERLARDAARRTGEPLAPPVRQSEPGYYQPWGIEPSPRRSLLSAAAGRFIMLAVSVALVAGTAVFIWTHWPVF